MWGAAHGGKGAEVGVGGGKPAVDRLFRRGGMVLLSLSSRLAPGGTTKNKRIAKAQEQEQPPCSTPLISPPDMHPQSHAPMLGWRTACVLKRGDGGPQGVATARTVQCKCEMCEGWYGVRACSQKQKRLSWLDSAVCDCRPHPMPGV